MPGILMPHPAMKWIYVPQIKLATAFEIQSGRTDSVITRRPIYRYVKCAQLSTKS
jgi:hypothetical protein